MSGGGAPRLTRWLLGRVLAEPDREHVLGDLEEEFAQIEAARGTRWARRWYRAQLLAALAPSLRRRLDVWRLGRARTATPRALGDGLHQARRALAHRPQLVGASLLTLSLGIGFATSISSIVYEVLLRPLPYPEGDRLVQIWNTYESWRGHEVLDPFWDGVGLSWPEYEALRDGDGPYERVSLYAEVFLPVTGFGDPREMVVGVASASLFEMLDVEPVLGRVFTEAEDGPARTRVALLTHETWRTSFGGAPDVVGRSLTLSGEPFAVIGVLPAGFGLRQINFPARSPKLAWVPIGSLGDGLDRGDHSYEGLGLLADGVDLASAAVATGSILANGSAQRGARVTARKTEEAGSAREPLLVLTAGVALLLLIACGNFATLLIGEVVKRRSELATRFALGAGRGRILTQLAIESMLLGGLGGLLAFPVTVVLTGALLRLAPQELLLPGAIPPDLRVLGLGAALGVLVGALFGLAPAASIRGRRLRHHLVGGRGQALERGAVRRGVLGGQIALSLVLLATGGILVRGLDSMSRVGVGFEAEGLWRGRVLVSSGSSSDAEARAAYHRILERLRAVPGVESASLVSALPFSGRGGSSSFQIVGREVAESEKSPEAVRRTVSPGFHEALGIPLLEGRHLSETDRTFAAPVTVVSRALADRYWPEGGAVGGRLLRDRREFEIVGVVGDVRHADLHEDFQPTLYVPFDVAETPFGMSVVLRAPTLTGDAVATALRGAVRAVDPRVPVEDVRQARALIDDSTREARFRATLLSAFAALATLLSAVGVFANTVRVVAARERELGIRLALGARRLGLIGAVVREEGVWLLAGLALGAAGAFGAGSALAGTVVGIDAFDPPSLAVAVGALLTSTLGAIAYAARRGTALDPVRAMRAE